jgi:DNA mismatch repair protein MutL
MNASKIRVLDHQTINKIAAGEVIENPASVVKELVENALDAEAASITVEIQEGGRQMIRITDDGIGMAKDDALLCFERHATSKIRDVEDIESLFTMGFRGEAIPSIAAISKFTLLTNPRTAGKAHEKGTLIVSEGGRILTCSEGARSAGTTIEVKSLFYNVPVRKKFQKSPSFDVQEILKVLSCLALAYPKVDFELVSDQKIMLKTSTAYTADASFLDLLKKRIAEVLGQDYASSLIPLAFSHPPYELEGFIGRPTDHRPNRTGQHLLINQRSVTAPLVSSAIREGYGTMLPNQRFPIFVLHLRMPGGLVDVNVHPQKKEVRLRHELELKETIINAVQSSLRRAHAPRESVSSERASPPPPSAWLPKGSFHPIFKKEEHQGKWELRKNETFPPLYQAREEAALYHASNPKASTPDPSPLPYVNTRTAPPRVISTLLDYCILDSQSLDRRLFDSEDDHSKGGLALLDQRAAHRRIFFDQLMKGSTQNASQSLLIPITWHTTPSEFRLITEHLEPLNQMGFGIRELGSDAFIVDAYPSLLKQDQVQNCLTLLVQDLSETQSSRALQARREERLALAACRASLPTNKRLSMEEAQALVAELTACSLPARCPLGKPTCLSLSSEEIAKWFQKKHELQKTP